MKQKLLIFFLFGVFALNNAFAQNRKITGTVTGSDDGLPLPGVSVMVTGTKTGSQTNEQGSYSVNTPTDARSLTFTYIGYTSKTVQIGNQSVVNVKLTSDNKSLNEVVITGYGVERKREVTGAIVSIKASQIEDRPIQTFDRALQGRAAGVSVTSSSGQPGASMSVQIRGRSTIFGSTDPLYIIDGVQVNAANISGSTSVNALSSINPDDIESIEVLKDAASSAIYGSQGGNGVVIVTTKRGKAGRTQVTASAQYGYTKTYNPYKVLNAQQYFDLQKEAYVNYNLRIGNTAAQGITAATAASFPSGLPSTIQNYDWVNAINRTGHVSQYDLSLSGGDAKTKFFISSSYSNTDGTILTSNFQRGTVRGNLDHKVSNKFSITSSLSLTGSGSVGPAVDAGFYTNTPFTGSLLTSPVNAIYNADGSYNTSLVGINTTNEIQYLNQEKRSTGTFQTVDNIALTYSILPELSLRVFGGIDFSDVRDYNYRPATLPTSSAVLGSGSEVYRRNINYLTNATLNFNKTFAVNHTVSALFGFEYRDVSNRALGASAQGFASPLLTLLSSASTPLTTTSSFTGYKNAGFLGQLKYDYKGKYLFTANGRYDGSSRFGTGNKYGFFGGGSAAWNITSEEFMQNVNVISQLKPRISYGITGTQPPNAYNFTSLALYGGGGTYTAGSTLGGLRPTQLVNEGLTWERTKSLDLGLDVGLFKDRLTVGFDIYRRNVSQLLLPVTLPSSSGFTSYFQNAGTS
ncbi:MAG: SusC/RagA family TonB-linked outer membrane protein, partial [Sphingobacteriaceae bacterium]